MIALMSSSGQEFIGYLVGFAIVVLFLTLSNKKGTRSQRELQERVRPKLTPVETPGFIGTNYKNQGLHRVCAIDGLVLVNKYYLLTGDQFGEMISWLDKGLTVDQYITINTIKPVQGSSFDEELYPDGRDFE